MIECFRRGFRGMGVSPMNHGQDARATTPVASALRTASRRAVFAIVSVTAALTLVHPARASRDFSRYQVILERQPFGFVPPDEEPVTQERPVVTGPSFADRLDMVAITERGGRIRVGFVDNNESPSRTYFLHVGDSAGGYTVVSADFKAETAWVRKDGQEAQLSIQRGNRSGNSAAAPDPARYGARGTRGTRGARPVVSRMPITRSTLTREQVRQEREAGLRPPPTAPHLALPQHADTPDMSELPPAVREHAMRQYNMELIRAGGEQGLPLPIELTPDEDAQLVKEGVLDP